MYYNLDQCEQKQNGIFNSVCNNQFTIYLLPNKWEESYKAAFRPITRIAIFLDMYFTTKHYLRDLGKAKVVRLNIRIVVCRFHLNRERFRSLFSPKMCWSILWYRTLVNFRHSVLEYSFEKIRSLRTLRRGSLKMGESLDSVIISLTNHIIIYICGVRSTAPQMRDVGTSENNMWMYLHSAVLTVNSTLKPLYTVRRNLWYIAKLRNNDAVNGRKTMRYLYVKCTTVYITAKSNISTKCAKVF